MQPPEASASADFTFDFVSYEDPGEGSRWSTWASIERLCRGPRPRPAWVVVADSAIDTELGILKTGKEADVFLLERVATSRPDDRAVMAAKRYRSADHRTFERSADYTDGRRLPRKAGRETRAVAKGSRFGRSVATGQWAWTEWQMLVRMHGAGLPVPYPVQIDGTEILMELVTDDVGAPAPRLAAAAAGVEMEVLQDWSLQVREIVLRLAQLGYAHGDLSAYNLLVAAGGQVRVIDLPQCVDLVGNPHGMEYLRRDCLNVATWFARRGVEVDAEALFGEAAATAF